MEIEAIRLESSQGKHLKNRRAAIKKRIDPVLLIAVGRRMTEIDAQIQGGETNHGNRPTDAKTGTHDGRDDPPPPPASLCAERRTQLA